MSLTLVKRLTKNTIIILFLLVPAGMFSTQRLRKLDKKYVEYFESGKVKKITRVKTAQTVGFELDNNYKRTSVWQTEFSEDGRMKTKYRKVTKIGSAGKNCYEIKCITRDYHPNGKLKQKTVSRCDKGKTVIKDYDEHGKLTFTRIIYEIR